MTPVGSIRYPLTVYYDGACPICVTEMSTLVRLDIAGRLVLFDCAGGKLDEDCREAGIASVDVLAAIHARDADGRWLRGVDVFAAAYRAAGLAPLAALFDHRVLRPIWDRLYPFIARHRYVLSRCGLHHVFRLIPHQRLLRSARRRATRAGASCSSGSCTVATRSGAPR